MTPDQARNLSDLRRLVQRFSAAAVSREEVVTQLRQNSEALTLTTRLRRSGLSEAAITAAMFDAPRDA